METKSKKLKPLAGMNLQELREVTAGLGMPKFVATQLAEWIYGKRVSSLEEMQESYNHAKGLLDVVVQHLDEKPKEAAANE